MLTVAPGGNNLATICYKDFLGLATINMYYYYYYYYYLLGPESTYEELIILLNNDVDKCGDFVFQFVI